jgi:hypothetical protein
VDGGLTLYTSHRALTQGLQSDLDEKKGIHRLDVEKRNIMERAGVVLKIELP